MTLTSRFRGGKRDVTEEGHLSLPRLLTSWKSVYSPGIDSGPGLREAPPYLLSR